MHPKTQSRQIQRHTDAQSHGRACLPARAYVGECTQIPSGSFQTTFESTPLRLATQEIWCPTSQCLEISVRARMSVHAARMHTHTHACERLHLCMCTHTHAGRPEVSRPVNTCTKSCTCVSTRVSNSNGCGARCLGWPTGGWVNARTAARMRGRSSRKSRHARARGCVCVPRGSAA